MEIGTIRGLVTAALLVLFLGVVGWAWSRHRATDFEAASQLPLDDAGPAPHDTENKEQKS